MSNLLKMAKIQSIISLHAQGWPARRIARELGVDRETVRKYVLQRSCETNPADLPTGFRRGPANRAEPYRDSILVGIAAGLSAVRIHQDLVAAGAQVGYDSVRRKTHVLRIVSTVQPQGLVSLGTGGGRRRYADPRHH